MRSESGSFFFYFFSRRAKERTGGVGDRSLLCVLFSSGCCCVPDVRRIIHQSGRGTIAWLSLTYQWPGAARSFACAQPPLHSVRALGSIHPSETVSSSSIESITFRALFSLFVLFFDRLFSLFTSFFFCSPPNIPSSSSSFSPFSVLCTQQHSMAVMNCMSHRT